MGGKITLKKGQAGLNRLYNTPLADDGYRDTDINMRNEVDKQFERMLKLWGGPYTEVRSKDIYRFDYVEHIKELNAKKI